MTARVPATTTTFSSSRCVATEDVEPPLSLEEADVLPARADATVGEMMVLLGLGNRRIA